MANPVDPKQQEDVAPASPAATATGMRSALEDRSMYIRTMAKDMAALSGASDKSAKAPPPEPEPVPPPARTVEGVALPEPEVPFFEKFQSLRSKRSEEPLELPSMEDAGAIVGPSPETPPIPLTPKPERPAPPPTEKRRADILDRLRRRVSDTGDMDIQDSAGPRVPSKPAEPLEPEWPDIPTPPANFAEAKAPAEPMPAPEPIPTPMPEPSRVEAPVMPEPPPPVPEPVLPPPPAPEQLPTPLPAMPEPAPIDPAPAFVPAQVPEAARPMPEPPPFKPRARFDSAAGASAWQNIPNPAPAAPKPERPVRASDSYREPIDTYAPPRPLAPVGGMHTYSSDFSDRIDQKSASTFSVLAAEQDARQGAPQPSAKRGVPKALIAVGTGIMLFALAGGGIYVTYQFIMTMRDTPIASLTVPSIVIADEYRQLEGTGSTLLQSLAASANGALVPGNVLVTYILTSGSDESGSIVTVPAGGAALVRALGVPAPDILLRNIAGESTVGAVNAGGQTRPFFALRVDSYERTYAGMLTWEPLMLRDLALLYPLYPAPVPSLETPPETASSTATSTATTSAPAATLAPVAPVPLTRFEDAIVSNRDVRVLYDTNGSTLLLYGYADKRTLLIARDEAAFQILLERLRSD